MKLSIVVLNYKSRNLVKYFLKRVLQFKLPFRLEIIVVDNNSGDGIGEMIKHDFPVTKFVQTKKNLGMGGGNNLGIKKSQGDYILIANPDITLSERAVNAMVDFLDNNEHVGIVGPKVLNPNKTPQESSWRYPSLLGFLYRRTFLGNMKNGKEYLHYFSYKDVDMTKSRAVDWVLGGCFMIRKKALDEVGMFDESFFLFLEDTDLCRRMWRHKYEVWYVNEAEVIHLPHRLSQSGGGFINIFSKLTLIHFFSWIRYFWKWRNRSDLN